ncbi:MAG TPA: hypothetical protein ENK14_11840 [Caldithrix sp.]|nr:hypothetical protein [Caldithrix sp.]
MWQAWVNGILGAWVFVAAFLAMGSKGNLWNDLIVGVITAVVGFLMVKAKPWQGWLTGIIGIWLIIAAFIPGLLVGSGLLWNNVIVGALLMIGGFGALGGSSHTVAHSN